MKKRKFVSFLAAGAVALGSMPALAQTYGTSENQDYYFSEAYEKTHEAIAYIKAKDIVCDPGQGIITFRAEKDFQGNPAAKDITFVIDKSTFIEEITSPISPDIDKFASGEYPWIAIYVTAADAERINASTPGESLTVHVDSVLGITKNIAVYPSQEEIQRNQRLKERGIMVGDEDGNFMPYGILTRAQMAKIAVMLYNPKFLEESPVNPPQFTDVPPTDWAYPYIAYAAAQRLLQGYPDGTFQPDRPITYAEALKVIVSVLGYAQQAEDAGGYPDGYIRQAVYLGLCGEAPQNQTLLRQDAAEIVDKAYNVGTRN